MSTEADSYRTYVLPKLYAAGWSDEQLSDLIEKYVEHRIVQFVNTDILKAPPNSERGNFMYIANLFNNPGKLRKGMNQLQTLLYAA